MREGWKERHLSTVRSFLETPLDDLLERSRREDPARSALELFRRTAASVPAYRDLLAREGLDPGSIRGPEDFPRVPVLTKKGYVLASALPDRCREGLLTTSDFIAASSGSTGEPTFWPRSAADECAIAARFEQVFADSFAAAARPTLAVVCFSLGTWVGGMFTTSCLRLLAAKGYPLTVVTPGSNKAEILRVCEALGPMFEQVVLLGYPPFLKDVVDSARATGFDWEPLHVKLVTAGEVFSEEWRALVGERAGMADVRRDTASLYGTADAGVLGNETPLTISIRRFLAARPEVARELFGEARLPTLVQYDPSVRFFELHDGRLVFTGDGGVPLVRYDILDTGGLRPFAELLGFVEYHGFRADPALPPPRPLPFVWVFGRSDFTVSFYGANVFPENVTVGLEQPGPAAWTTGKFVLSAVEDEERDARLEVVVELAPGEEPSPERTRRAAEAIRDQLLRLSSEFGAYVPAGRQLPRVRLRPFGDPEHFPPGVKHRYTRR